MKKVITICITLALLLALMPAAFAETPDISGMSTEDLLALILAARQELAARRPENPAPEEILQSLEGKPGYHLAQAVTGHSGGVGARQADCVDIRLTAGKRPAHGCVAKR